MYYFSDDIRKNHATILGLLDTVYR